MSLGQAAFMGVGAYSSALLVTGWGCPFILSILIAGLVAALLGIVWHPAFFLVGLFGIGVAGVSAYVASSRESAQESQGSHTAYNGTHAVA